MLEFRNIEIKDKVIFNYYASLDKSYFCERCFVDLYMWCDHYLTQMCIKDDFLFLKMKIPYENTVMYLAPLGTGDYKHAINLLENECESTADKLILTSVSDNAKDIIESIMPGKFKFYANRDGFDYIYSSEDLITLKGKQFHSKRNFINRFKNDYTNRWVYEDMNCSNKKEAFRYHLKWCEENDHNHDDDFMGETIAIAKALKDFDKLEIKGGILRIDGVIKAFTFGAAVSDELFVIQIEKASHDIIGAYQMINNQFAIYNLENFKYVNREEDLGIEGLRKAKLSYNPVMMGIKYTGVLV